MSAEVETSSGGGGDVSGMSEGLYTFDVFFAFLRKLKRFLFSRYGFNGPRR